MHKLTSDLAQRRARQLWQKDLPVNVDWDNLPTSEKRANLVLASKNLAARLAALPKLSPERASIGAQINATNLEINALRPKLKGGKDVPSFFLDVCRERLNKAQFNAILGEASNRARELQSQLGGAL